MSTEPSLPGQGVITHRGGEDGEVSRQAAGYCGVPAASRAFAVAPGVLDREDGR